MLYFTKENSFGIKPSKDWHPLVPTQRPQEVIVTKAEFRMLTDAECSCGTNLGPLITAIYQHAIDNGYKDHLVYSGRLCPNPECNHTFTIEVRI